jgi:tetratricopeptide (TPR) repeat protein
MMCCGSCGIAEVDEIKLKTCTACKLVRYCSVKCQREHRPKHKKACKKRVAELRDEILFQQPESNHYGDCPICLVPLPLVKDETTIMTCCSKIICNGCDYSNLLRESKESLETKCPFCRQPSGGLSLSEAEADKNTMKRIEANDPVAMSNMGKLRYDEGDYSSAFEYWTKAAGMGDIDSHFHLGDLYRNGQGVEKDKKKELYHWEKAAIGGHAAARYNLGCNEGNNGRIERAVKHFIISAYLGYDRAIEVLKGEYANGTISKEDFAAALRAHHTAVDATKSPQREAAKEAKERGEFIRLCDYKVSENTPRF